MYSTGESEEIVGKALKGRREDVVLATKVHFPLHDDSRNRSGNAADLTLDDATLDRIDEIVPPGTDLWDTDAARRPQSLTTPTTRRRPPTDR
jgi:diketogulonate reductase-like aldo/keto reductase